MEYRAIVTGTNNFSFVIEEALNIFIGIKGLDGRFLSLDSDSGFSYFS